MKTKNTQYVGGWIKRFLIEYIITEKNLSLIPQHYYKIFFLST